MENLNQTKKHGHEENVLHFTINDKKYGWTKQFITGIELRKLGQIASADQLFLAIKRPWEDELIADENEVDLARPGLEHFFSIKHGHVKLVSIFINDNKKEIARGKHTVAEIKKLGEIDASHELEELIDGKLVPLDDSASVLIKGCEQFFSHVRDGCSS